MHVSLRYFGGVIFITLSVLMVNQSEAADLKSAVFTYEKKAPERQSEALGEVIYAFYPEKTVLDEPGQMTCIDYSLQQIRIEPKNGDESVSFPMTPADAKRSGEGLEEPVPAFSSTIETAIATPEVQKDTVIQTPLRGYAVTRFLVIWGKEIMLSRQVDFPGVEFAGRKFYPGIEEYLMTTDPPKLEMLLELLNTRQAAFADRPLLKRADPAGMFTLLKGVPVRFSAPTGEVMMLKSIEFDVGKKQDYIFTGACR